MPFTSARRLPPSTLLPPCLLDYPSCSRAFIPPLLSYRRCVWGVSVYTLEGLSSTHLVVNIGLTSVTPGRQVNIAEDQWVS